MNKLILALMLTAFGAVSAHAQVLVTEPWVRATVAAQKATGAFMQLKSTQDARLLEVTSPVAGTVEIHQMEMSGDVMKMRQVPDLPLPAGKAVELKPGGYHIMLLNLKAQVKTGDVIPLTLVVERGGKRETIVVNAVAKSLTNSQHSGH